MPLSKGLKFFKKILKLQLKADEESVKRIKIKDKGSLIKIFIQCENKTAELEISKGDVVEINNNTKENYSLIYFVRNISWRGLPL